MINARVLAFQALLHIEQSLSHPDRLIRSMLERHSGLDIRDRALLTELVYGTLRWQGRLDWHIDQLSSTKPGKIAQSVRILLRMALYQILFLERIPAHAAVNESVNIAKSTQPPYVVRFVNGLLREAIRRNPDWSWPDGKRNPEEYLAVTTSHPGWLVRKLLAERGFDEARAICDANNTVAPMVLRVNTLKVSSLEAMEWFRAEGIEVEPSPWIDNAIRTVGIRQDVTRTLPYLQGWIQIQDEASQLIAHLVKPGPGERVLDLCSGFGGKSTQLAVLMKNEGEIVSVDEAAWKLEELRANAERQAIDIIMPLAANVLDLERSELGSFDRVLLDAPCTGSGVIRRNPDIKWRRHPKDPYRFSRIQESLLQHASGFVREGGTLVYATCSIFREENEEVANRFTENNPGWTIEPADGFLPEICRSMVEGAFFRPWPHRHGTDGFFAARWRKEEGEGS